MEQLKKECETKGILMTGRPAKGNYVAALVREQVGGASGSSHEGPRQPPPPLVVHPPPTPPSDGQAPFAMMLAAKTGAAPLQPYTLKDKLLTSNYIDENRHLMR